MQEPLNESGPELVVVCRARKARRRKFHVAVGISKSLGSNLITITLASNAIGNTRLFEAFLNWNLYRR